MPKIAAPSEPRRSLLRVAVHSVGIISARRNRPTFTNTAMRLGVILLGVLCLWPSLTKAEPKFASVVEHLAYFAGLPEEELAKFDIAYVNLVCAEGLNGSEDLDIPACLRSLDEIAGFVKANTAANIQVYGCDPSAYANSESQFRALAMVTFAVKGYGIQYNPDRIERADALSPNDVFFRDSKDIFLHGLLQRQPRMGTCTSLPVFWVALGRRLNYPLSLSNTLLHFFTRWEDASGKFDFEGSQNGCGIHDDAYYKGFPVQTDDAKIEYLGLLQSFSRKGELMHFLLSRGACLTAHKRDAEATRAYELAVLCYPSNFSKWALHLHQKELLEKHE